MCVKLANILAVVQARALVISMALLVVVVIVSRRVWRPRTDSIVALRFGFVFATIATFFVARGQARTHALLLSNGQLASSRRSLRHALRLVLLDELVDYLDEALLVQLAVA